MPKGILCSEGSMETSIIWNIVQPLKIEKAPYVHFKNRKEFDGSSLNDDSVFTCSVT